MLVQQFASCWIPLHDVVRSGYILATCIESRSGVYNDGEKTGAGIACDATNVEFRIVCYTLKFNYLM